jgi:hypothetical protein
MAKHRTHSIEFKRQVVQEFLGGESLHESRNARLILGQHIGGRRVAVEPTGLELGDPDLNQIAADPVAPGEGGASHFAIG